MSTSDITNKVSPKPLEGMKTSVQKRVDTVETEGLDRIGFFDEVQKPVCFDATTGSIVFNPEINFDTKVPDGIKSNLFNPGEWTSIVPNSVNLVAKTADVAKTVVSEVADASFDLFNQITGKAEISQNEDSSKLDPTVAKKQEEIKKYSVIKNAEEVIAKAQANYRGEKMFEEAVHSKSSGIAELANLQGNYRDVLDDKGDVRKDLETSIAQARKRILESQQAKQKPLVSTSKKGGQGQILSNDDNRSGETHQTAQTATG